MAETSDSLASGKQVYLVASGDLRLSANQKCWPAQQDMERTLQRAVAEAGYKVVRAHHEKSGAGHGFIASQREGMSVFREIPPTAHEEVMRVLSNETWLRSMPGDSSLLEKRYLVPDGIQAEINTALGDHGWQQRTIRLISQGNHRPVPILIAFCQGVRFHARDQAVRRADQPGYRQA